MTIALQDKIGFFRKPKRPKLGLLGSITQSVIDWVIAFRLNEQKEMKTDNLFLSHFLFYWEKWQQVCITGTVLAAVLEVSQAKIRSQSPFLCHAFEDGKEF